MKENNSLTKEEWKCLNKMVYDLFLKGKLTENELNKKEKEFNKRYNPN